MKFLCVECDVPMALKETKGPENGSMTVVFGCRSCGRQIAMLTNEMETQMVHSLGVKIGGRKEKAAPMETIRTSLSGYRTEDDVPLSAEPPTESSATSSGGCPFSEMVAGSAESSSENHAAEGANGHGHEAQPKAPELRWTAEAKHRMERIPAFVRPMVERGVEDYARANDVVLVDEKILQDVRERFGF